MTLYVLTMSGNEENFKPEVFATKEAAVARLQAYVKDTTEDFDDVFSAENDGDHAEIIYTDDRYDLFDIFEVEVQEGEKQ